MANIAISEMDPASSLAGNEIIEVSQLSVAVTITAATISAAAADNSFNDSGSGFASAGFAEGDRVNVTGFTESANNLFTGIVTSLVAGKIIIGGTDGDGIVDEAAGGTVTITKWTSKRAEIDDISGASSNFSISAYVPGTYTDGQIMAGVLPPIACTIPADLTGTTAKVFGTNPTASAVVTLKKNGTSFGTITIATDGGITLAAALATSFNGTSDYLEIVAPASADATLDGVNINLLAARA